MRHDPPAGPHMADDLPGLLAEAAAADGTADEALSEEDEAVLSERLRALGYLE